MTMGVEVESHPTSRDEQTAILQAQLEVRGRRIRELRQSRRALLVERAELLEDSARYRKTLRYRIDRVLFHVRQPGGLQHLFVIMYRLTTRAMKKVLRRIGVK